MSLRTPLLLWALGSLSLVARVVAAPLPVHTVEDLRYLGGGIADSFRGRIEGQRYALKPLERFGESMHGDFGQANPEAELICLPIMRALGLVAPEAMLFRPGPEAPPVLAVSWVDEDLAGGPVRSAKGFLNSENLAQVDADSFALMFMADALIANPDRHGGNYFLRTDPRGTIHPIPIDHNLALFPPGMEGLGKPEEVGSVFFDKACYFAGQLALDPDWGGRLLRAVQEIQERLTPEFLVGLVDALPEVIPEGRRSILRDTLVARLRGLGTAATAWQANWKPTPPPADDLPSIPGRLGQIAQWAPGRIPVALVLFQQILDKDQRLEASLRDFLALPPEVDAGKGLRIWMEEMAATYAEAHGQDLPSLRASLQEYSGRFAAFLTAARDFFARSLSLPPEESYRRAAPVIMDAAWNGQRDLIRLFHRLVREDLQDPEPLGAHAWFRAVLAMGDAVGEPGLKARLQRLYPMLQAARSLVHDQAEAARIRFHAKMTLAKPFGRLVTQSIPGILPSQAEEALCEVLRNFPRDLLREQQGRFHPAALGLALGAAADRAGHPWSHAEYWSILREHANLDQGAWLAGWMGPVDADDARISVQSLQTKGWSADSAARLLFERLALGPYGSWRALAQRISDPELTSRLVFPSQSEPPPLPRLYRAKSMMAPWTAPRAAVRGLLGEDPEEILVEVSIPGKESVIAARIRARQEGAGNWIVTEANPDLDLEAGDPVPRDLQP